MSFNLRYWNEYDGNNSWPQRRSSVVKLILEQNPMIIGTQEGLPKMLEDLDGALPKYQRVGESRGAKGEEEFCAIYFRRDLFEVLQTDQIWLSETPSTPGSQSWDSSLPRICTWAVLKHRLTGKQFVFFNTHLDHMGEQARLEGAKLILEQIKPYKSKRLPCLLTGDFNCQPASAPIRLLSTQLVDALASIGHGGVGTFHNFTGVTTEGPIDYIFVSDSVQVLDGKVIDSSVDGQFPSDHFPIIVSVRI